MLLDDKQEFKNMDPLRLFEYINLPHVFHRHKKTSWLALSLEIFYSRFMILHELCRIFPQHEIDLYDVFIREKQQQKNPVNAFYHTYLEYHMTSIMFPDKLDSSSYLNKMIQYGKKEWKIKEKDRSKTPPISPKLPRFFSHPDVRLMEGTHVVNHFYERHKIFSIVAHAICHNPRLGFMTDKLTAFGHYLQPILVANRHVSVANHLFLYKESTLE